MYHVSNDKRSQKSAQLIWEGMEKALQEKPLCKLRVTDIYEKSFVSRATFYRLFDSVEDVLSYKCDLIYLQLTEVVQNVAFDSKQQLFLCFIEKWLEQEVLIKTLVENNLVSVIYETHMKNRDLMKEFFLKDATISDDEADYLSAILATLIPASVNVWCLHGKTDTPSEIYHAVSHSLKIIGRELPMNESNRK